MSASNSAVLEGITECENGGCTIKYTIPRKELLNSSTCNSCSSHGVLDIFSLFDA